jgi:hypothetical protein
MLPHGGACWQPSKEKRAYRLGSEEKYKYEKIKELK